MPGQKILGIVNFEKQKNAGTTSKDLLADIRLEVLKNSMKLTVKSKGTACDGLQLEKAFLKSDLTKKGEPDPYRIGLPEVYLSGNRRAGGGKNRTDREPREG